MPATGARPHLLAYRPLPKQPCRGEGGSPTPLRQGTTQPSAALHIIHVPTSKDKVDEAIRPGPNGRPQGEIALPVTIENCIRGGRPL